MMIWAEINDFHVRAYWKSDIYATGTTETSNGNALGITGRNSIGYSQNENCNPTVSNKIVITITITPKSMDSTSHFRFFVIIHKI